MATGYVEAMIESGSSPKVVSPNFTLLPPHMIFQSIAVLCGRHRINSIAIMPIPIACYFRICFSQRYNRYNIFHNEFNSEMRMARK